MHRIARSTRRIAAWFCFAVASLGAALPGAAAPMSDIWFNRNEQGWGMNTIDQRGVLFVTLFVYGSDGRPTWYVGSETTLVSGTRRYTGPLYATTGPYFGGAFTGTVGVRQVGTISITVGGTLTTASVTYTVDGVSVTKNVERQTWRSLNPPGTYFGAIDAGTGCTITGLTTNADAVTFTVALSGSALTLTMTGSAAGTLTLNAPVTQFGSVYYGVGTIRVGATTYPAAIADFNVDDDGIAGDFQIQAPSGCVLSVRFSGLRPR